MGMDHRLMIHDTLFQRGGESLQVTGATEASLDAHIECRRESNNKCER